MGQSVIDILPGPIDVLVDVPILMGCYAVLSMGLQPSHETGDIETKLTPATCITQCLKTSKRFSGKFKIIDLYG